MNKKLPSIERVKSLLNYDPDTGIFTWKVARGRVTVGSVAGQINQRWRYRTITIDKNKYYAHRLAWYITTGEDPGELDIDHINHDRDDNRIDNLRLTTRSENCLNNGLTPTYVHKKINTYISQFSLRGKKYYLGCFPTHEEAHETAVQKRNSLLAA
jgi:hypothetical protein